MRKKITALSLVGLAYLSVCSFTVRNDGQDIKSSEVISSNPKDLDVQMVLQGLGISTSIDNKALETAHPSVNLKIASGKGINLDFNNPMAQPYSLDVFDSEGTLVASVDNIVAPVVTLPSNMFNKGSYIYKLSGEGNTYAGKFFYH